MVESESNPDQANPHKKKRAMGYIKMIIMDNVKSTAINYEVAKSVDSNATLITDGMPGFAKLKEIVSRHKYFIVPKKEAGKTLPWVHTVIANAKRLFLGIHHSIGKDYLQNYLNEYCYKLNRRNFQSDLFDRMIVAGVNDTWY